MCTGGRDNFFLDLSVFLERKVYDFRIMVGKEFLVTILFSALTRMFPKPTFAP